MSKVALCTFKTLNYYGLEIHTINVFVRKKNSRH